MKPLTLEETRLKEEMKNNCLKVGKYKDEKAKDKFEMLCHLEDFEVQYWELQQENKQLKKDYDRIYNENCKLREEHNITDISLLDENYKLKDNWDELKECLKDVMNSSDGDNKDFVETILDIIQEIEQGSDSNEA